jgi:SAM-dependent methyltransferase
LDPASVREALFSLARDPGAFKVVLGPGGYGRPEAQLDPAVVGPLVEAGIAHRDDGWIRPRLPAMLRNGRPYLMTLGADDGFVQDVWPETDALLARLGAQSERGSCLDVCAGSGVVGIEAALAGFRVTSTDIEPTLVELVGWNAALHGVDVERRVGHLFEPVGGRRFDLILCAPHYGATMGLLRLEVLQAGLAHVAPGGALVIATYLEWTPGQRPGIVESVLAPLVAAGARVSVRPVDAATLQHWFWVPSPTVEGVGAAHRFLIEVRPDGPAGLELVWPQLTPRRAIVPLARLVGGRSARAQVRALLDAETSHPAATVTTAEDLTALEGFLDEVATGMVELAQPIAFQLHDGCRFGAETCRRSFDAIVDTQGGVRMCAHGDVVGQVGDTDASYRAGVLRQQGAAELRRGCATCPAADRCSRCLFPHVLDEGAYCTLIRRRADALADARRLLSLVASGFPRAHQASSLRAKLRPGGAGGPRLAARRDPRETAPAGDPVRSLAARLTSERAALLASDGQAAILLDSTARLDASPASLELVELAWEGASSADLDAYATERGFDPQTPRMVLSLLAGWLGS